MNVKEFKESLKYLFEAQVTPFVWGHAGIGKSSIVKQYAKENGYYFFPLYLGTQSDLGDILGLAEFVKDESGQSIATSFMPPSWLVEAVRHCEANPNSGAIIFLDEFNRARRDIIAGCFSLALDKTIHTLKLPKNCYVIAAGNPPTDEYHVTDVDDTALMARFVHIKLEPTTSEWISFAKSVDMESDLINFIQEQPGMLNDAKSEFKLPVKVDSRSYERLNRLYKVKTPENLITSLMYGILGIERSLAFNEFKQKQDKPLTAEEILNGARADILKKMCMPGDTKNSLIAASCDTFIQYLTDSKDEDPSFTDQEVRNIIGFFMELPAENFILLIKNASGVNSKKYNEFSDRDDVVKHIGGKLREVKTALKEKGVRFDV